jgi:hypothetical protein
MEELKKSSESHKEKNSQLDGMSDEIQTLKGIIESLKVDGSAQAQNHPPKIEHSPHFQQMLNESKLQREYHRADTSVLDFNRTLADMFLIYPDYKEQEAEANKLNVEELGMVRMNIAKCKQFTGVASDWASFKTRFVQSSKRGHYRAIEDMERLKDLIQGEALLMFKTELWNPFANPLDFLKELDQFYGKEANPVRQQLSVIASLKRIEKQHDKVNLLELLSAIKHYALLCRQFAQTGELTAESSLYMIESKMFEDHVTRWRKWIKKNGKPRSVDGIAAFLEEQLKRINERSSTHAGRNQS